MMRSLRDARGSGLVYTSDGRNTMKIRTNIKANGSMNHNAKLLVVRTKVRAGALTGNHNVRVRRVKI